MKRGSFILTIRSSDTNSNKTIATLTLFNKETRESFYYILENQLEENILMIFPYNWKIGIFTSLFKLKIKKILLEEVQKDFL